MVSRGAPGFMSMVHLTPFTRAATLLPKVGGVLPNHVWEEVWEEFWEEWEDIWEEDLGGHGFSIVY